MKAQYLLRFQQCRGCGRAADGVLMSNRNDDMGPHCLRCADKRIQMDKEKTT